MREVTRKTPNDADEGRLPVSEGTHLPLLYFLFFLRAREIIRKQPDRRENTESSFAGRRSDCRYFPERLFGVTLRAAYDVTVNSAARQLHGRVCANRRALVTANSSLGFCVELHQVYRCTTTLFLSLFPVFFFLLRQRNAIQNGANTLLRQSHSSRVASGTSNDKRLARFRLLFFFFFSHGL